MDVCGYPLWISNPLHHVGYVPLEAHIYPYIYIHMYPTYPTVSIHIRMVQVLTWLSLPLLLQQCCSAAAGCQWWCCWLPRLVVIRGVRKLPGWQVQHADPSIQTWTHSDLCFYLLSRWIWLYSWFFVIFIEFIYPLIIISIPCCLYCQRRLSVIGIAMILNWNCCYGCSVIIQGTSVCSVDWLQYIRFRKGSLFMKDN